MKTNNHIEQKTTINSVLTDFVQWAESQQSISFNNFDQRTSKPYCDLPNQVNLDISFIADLKADLSDIHIYCCQMADNKYQLWYISEAEPEMVLMFRSTYQITYHYFGYREEKIFTSKEDCQKHLEWLLRNYHYHRANVLADEEANKPVTSKKTRRPKIKLTLAIINVLLALFAFIYFIVGVTTGGVPTVDKVSFWVLPLSATLFSIISLLLFISALRGRRQKIK